MIDKILHRRVLRRWGLVADQAGTADIETLRGARTRDAKAWAYYLNLAIDLFGADSDVVFAQHHWPTWGRERCVEFLAMQRDMYLYLHDQTLRMANHGLNATEIAAPMPREPPVIRTTLPLTCPDKVRSTKMSGSR